MRLEATSVQCKRRAIPITHDQNSFDVTLTFSLLFLLLSIPSFNFRYHAQNCSCCTNTTTDFINVVESVVVLIHKARWQTAEYNVKQDLVKIHYSVDLSHHPTTGLHVEVKEMPVDLRRRRSASQYSLKISTNITNAGRNWVSHTPWRTSKPNLPLCLQVKTNWFVWHWSLKRKTRRSSRLSRLFHNGRLIQTCLKANIQQSLMTYKVSLSDI